MESDGVIDQLGNLLMNERHVFCDFHIRFQELTFCKNKGGAIL